MSDEQRPADEEPEDEEVILLTDEDGNEHEFTIVQVIKVDDKDYAILMSAEDAEDEGAVILRIDINAAGEDELVEIEDDDEFERVAEVWEDLLDEEDDGDDSPQIDG